MVPIGPQDSVEGSVAGGINLAGSREKAAGAKVSQPFSQGSESDKPEFSEVSTIGGENFTLSLEPH